MGDSRKYPYLYHRRLFRISEGEEGFTIMEFWGHGGYLQLEIRRHGGISGVEIVEWVPWIVVDFCSSQINHEPWKTEDKHR